jgi:hypothetical protein
LKTVLQTYVLRKAVTSYLNKGFQTIMNYGVVCNSNPVYYVLDNSGEDSYLGFIAKYDAYWNYLNGSTPFSYPNCMIAVSFTNSTNIYKLLYMTANGGLYEIDENLIIQKFFAAVNGYKGLYYNTSGDYLLVTTSSFARIDVYSRNFSLLRSISVTYPNNYIAEYNGLLYVSSTTSYVIVLQNEVVVSSFATLCTVMKSLLIDQNGLIAVNHYSTNLQYVYLYYPNGTYSGVQWLSTIPYTNHIGFDTNGNLLLSSKNGIYIFNSPIASSNETSFSNADACIIKSIQLFNFKKLKIKF